MSSRAWSARSGRRAGHPHALLPFMLAGEAVGAETVEAHIRENPEAAKRGIGIIAESLMIFVQECIRLGVDRFYHSTQGGEASRLGGTGLFEECVKPSDLLLMNEIDRSCLFDVLDICDYFTRATMTRPPSWIIPATWSTAACTSVIGCLRRRRSPTCSAGRSWAGLAQGDHRDRSARRRPPRPRPMRCARARTGSSWAPLHNSWGRQLG